jgi:hypothetical protein
MVRKRNKIIFICLGIALIVMVITNPGLERFNTFISNKMEDRGFSKEYLEKNLRCVRPENFFILSKYYYYINDHGSNVEGDYVGVFGFFIPIRLVSAAN